MVQGQYAVKRFTTIAGTGTSRLYSSQPFNASLELEFNNISDNAATQIAACYESAQGSYAALTLPQELWSGVSSDLRDQLSRDYIWRFSEQPKISSVVPGISSVSVKLDGHRDG